MQLISVDRQTSIEISQAKRGGLHAPYKLRVQSAVGGFVGENDSVHFINTDEFMAAMKLFLRLRQGTATLRAATCELEFFRWITKGDVGIRYVIGTQFMEGETTKYSSIALSGSFKLPGEFAEQMATQLLETQKAFLRKQFVALRHHVAGLHHARGLTVLGRGTVCPKARHVGCELDAG